MIHFERTHDLDLVKWILTSDRSVWEAASEDASDARTFEPNDHPAIWYVLAIAGTKFGGLFTLIPQNSVCFEIHASHAFGAESAAAAREIAPWAFRNIPGCRRIVASIPAMNRIAIRAAKRAGFVEYGRNPRSFLKRGELVDQILAGISR